MLFDISIVAKHSIYHGVITVPGTTIIDLSCSEQEQLLFELRHARCGYFLALRIILLCAAGYSPKANPIERVFWEVHDKCTRNHQRKQIGQLVGDVERHLKVNGPWRYKLSEIPYTAEVTDAVKKLEKQQLLQAA